MRGYKSDEGMSNGIALTQWLYSGADEHDLAKEMAAVNRLRRHLGAILQNRPPPVEQLQS